MIWHLFLGGLAGFLAGKVMRGEGYGIIIDIILGLVGGWFGSWVLGFIWVGGPSFSYFITAFLGAVLLVWISRLISGSR
jgi:uncharacterized membrane protein YeaQ/YmgE (transglycosylase-associated protein family)